jgi:hypothetical protein
VGEHLAPISELGEHDLEGRINVDAQSAQRSVNQAYRTWACGPLLAHGKTRLASGLFYI